MATKILSTKQIHNLFIKSVQTRIYYENKTKLTMYMKCFNSKNFANVTKCNFSVNSIIAGSAGRAETTSTTQGLSKLQAQELVLRLNAEERTLLFGALQEYQSKLVKDEYEAESVPKPTTRNLIDIAVANSIPFIGFGFLDNFFMLLFGDYIDLYLGSSFCITTMAAAAIGNTFSDILGIGTAFYVERLANKIGYRPPKLSPIQMDMPVSRNFANLGRVLGVTIGCILGMFPLLFRSPKEAKQKEEIELVMDSLN